MAERDELRHERKRERERERRLENKDGKRSKMTRDAERDVSYGKREIADRMDVPLGIGSRREPRGAAPLSQARHASRRSGRSGRGLRWRGRRVRTYGDVEIAG